MDVARFELHALLAGSWAAALRQCAAVITVRASTRTPPQKYSALALSGDSAPTATKPGQRSLVVGLPPTVFWA